MSDSPVENPLYWAAVLAQAVRDGNKARIREAQANLRRLGVPLVVGERRDIRKPLGT